VTIIKRGAARVLELSEDEIAEAVRAYFQDTHNVAEGAGAAPLAGLMQERARMTGKRVAVILSGGNIDASVYRGILVGETPKVGSRRSTSSPRLNRTRIYRRSSSIPSGRKSAVAQSLSGIIAAFRPRKYWPRCALPIRRCNTWSVRRGDA
jgi:hypothetical protein